MGLKSFTDAMAALLVNEPAFVADITALIGQPVTRVLRSNTPWAQINANDLPCFVIEQGDGDASSWGTGESSGLTIGHTEQQFESPLDVCLLWNQTDRETAGSQRTQLPEIFARLMLRNPQPGDIAGAWLQRWVPDQGVLHPRHVWSAQIHAEYTIERDP